MTINEVKTKSNNLNHKLKWIEIFGLVIFLVWFCAMLIFLDTNCINNVCREVLTIDGSLYMTVIKYILPIFGFLSLFRVGLNHFGNKRNGKFNPTFYLSLVLLLGCYAVFSYFAKDFYYFYLDPDSPHIDSPYVMYTLFLFGITCIMLLKDKKTWDKSTFFVKTRIIFYVFHLALMIINIKIGVLSFALFTPFLIASDLIKKTHFNWEE